MNKGLRGFLLIALSAAVALPLAAQEKRKVIIDEDSSGPATTGLQAVLVLIQSPEVEPLGITVVSGDQWRDEEVAHALRLLEIIGRTDIPVVPGALFPLVNSKEEVDRWEKLHGKVPYQGAWQLRGRSAGGAAPLAVGNLPESNPTTKSSDEDAAHFLVRMVRRYPHQITIYEGGPMTNLALAIALDPQFPELARELVFMGGSLNPQTNDPEFLGNPRHEFNFWWDPEAARMVLHGRWPKITCTPVDISIKTRLRKPLIAEIGQARTPVAQYLARYADEEYMWDELAAAAWLDPSLITGARDYYLDVDIGHGAGYGDTLTWLPGQNPGLGEQLVHVQLDLNVERFYRLFVDLMTRPTPGAHPAAR